VSEAAAEIDAVDQLVGEPTREIAEFMPTNPVAVLVDEKKYSEFYKRVKAEVAAHVPDLSTEKGRKEIASLAYKVTRSKTAIDAAGKKLNEEATAKIAVVNASRRKIREELEALAEEVRAPLTKWEEAELDRLAKIEAVLSRIEGIQVSIEDGSNFISDRVEEVNSIEIEPEVFQERVDEGNGVKKKALQMLGTALERARKHEADQAELAKLREAAEKAEAERLERERVENEKAEREAAEARRREDEDRGASNALNYIKGIRSGLIGGQPQPFVILLHDLETRFVMEDYAERHREAIIAARDEAHSHLTSEMERDAEKRRADDAAAEQERVIAAEKAARVEADRVAQEKIAKAEAEAAAIKKAAEDAERERQRKADDDRREDEKRAADRKHRGEIMAAAKKAVMALGLKEDTAKKIVLAIVANEIPNVTLRF
jgi:colicin import membrane protein